MFHGLLSIFSFKLFQCHNIHCKLVLDILTPCLNKCLKYINKCQHKLQYLVTFSFTYEGWLESENRQFLLFIVSSVPPPPTPPPSAPSPSPSVLLKKPMRMLNGDPVSVKNK